MNTSWQDRQRDEAWNEAGVSVPLSLCCHAPALGQLRDTSTGVPVGYCGKCGSYTGFSSGPHFASNMWVPALSDLAPRRFDPVEYRLAHAHRSMLLDHRLIVAGVCLALTLGVAVGWLYLEGWLGGGKGLQGGLQGGAEHFVGGIHATYFTGTLTKRTI